MAVGRGVVGAGVEGLWVGVLLGSKVGAFDASRTIPIDSSDPTSR